MTENALHSDSARFIFVWRFRYLALAFAAILLLWNLNYAPVWNPDEGRYISAALEMLAPIDGSTPDWVVPHLNTLPRLNKPPLVYWCAATFFKFLGINVAVARLVPALAAIGILLILWRLGTAMFDEKTGLLASLIWVTCLLPFVLARVLSTDMLLAFSTALTMLGIYEIAARQRASRKIQLFGAVIIAGIGLGLALLAKGPVGVLLPLTVLFVWWILVSIRSSNALRNRTRGLFAPIFSALLIAGVLALPWSLAIGRSYPEFLRNFIIGENLARFSGSKTYHTPEPFWYYGPIILLGLLPWSAFLWPALRNLFANFSFRRVDAEAASTSTFSLTDNRLFLWLWAAAVVALFSLSQTKLITYILPGLPPFALLIAEVFSGRNEDQKFGENKNPAAEKALRFANKLTIALLFLLAVGLGVAFSSSKLLADKYVARADSNFFIFLVCLILVAGTFGLMGAHRADSVAKFRRRVAGTLVITGAVLFLTLISFIGRFARYEDSSAALIALMPYLRPGDRVIQFKTFQPSAMFYTRAPSVIMDFVNTSGLQEEKFNTSPLFPKDAAQIERVLQSSQRIYVLVRWKHAHWKALAHLQTIGRNNDFRLLSNRAAPAGFQFEYIAPGKRARKLSPACQNFAPDC